MSEDNKIIITFDATELDDFDLCQFRWHMVHHRNIGPKNTPTHFELGSLLHYFMELYYGRKKEKGGIEQSDLEEIIEKGRMKSLDYSMEVDEVSMTVFQFREYHRYYADETIIPVYIEQPFIVKLYEDDDIIIYITGKPDLVFHYPNSSDLVVLDHKRVTREFEYSPMRNQFLLYCTAIGTDTFVLNKIGFQKSKSPKDRFLRKIMLFNDELKEEWKRETVFIAKQMLLVQQSGYYKRQRTSCEKFNGCFLQRYCTTRPNGREFLIGTEYKIGVKWDVSSTL